MGRQWNVRECPWCVTHYVLLATIGCTKMKPETPFLLSFYRFNHSTPVSRLDWLIEYKIPSFVSIQKPPHPANSRLSVCFCLLRQNSDSKDKNYEARIGRLGRIEVVVVVSEKWMNVYSRRMMIHDPNLNMKMRKTALNFFVASRYLYY
jgi:hypothetical protein